MFPRRHSWVVTIVRCVLPLEAVGGSMVSSGSMKSTPHGGYIRVSSSTGASEPCA